MLKRLAITAATLAAATAPAFAHINPMEHGSFLAGVSHPLTGLDHGSGNIDGVDLLGMGQQATRHLARAAARI